MLESEIRIEKEGKEEIAISTAKIVGWEIILDEIIDGPYGTKIKDPYFVLAGKNGNEIRVRLSENRDAHIALLGWVASRPKLKSANPKNANLEMYPPPTFEVASKSEGRWEI